jgi:hypothetical protein
MLQILFLLLVLAYSSSAFPMSGTMEIMRTNVVVLHAEGTGGWGLGNSREMIPEEFAKKVDRRAFDGYKMTERGEFMRQVNADFENMQKEEMDELLGVAAMAGIRVKDPKERLDEFEPELFDDDEDLDLRV